MEKLGIKFAPLNIPLERRLQTLSALFWFTSLVFGSFFCFWLAAYLIFFTNYWYLALFYLCWAYYDRETPYKGGRKLCLLQNLLCWKYFNDYFPIILEKTEDLIHERNYLFCCHPHGILCAGMFGNFVSGYSKFTSLFPGLKMYCATIDMHFKSPFFRDYVMGLGAVSTAKESLHYVLNDTNKGNAMALAIGGAEESFYAKPGTYRVVLKKRKGFIKIALETGCSLVPVFSFGETELYDQVYSPPGCLLNKVQKFMKNCTGFVPIVPKGRGLLQYSFGLVPIRSPITTVVGRSIDVPKTVKPSEEIIQKYHSMYTEALLKLFNDNKEKYIKNPEKAFLIIE